MFSTGRNSHIYLSPHLDDVVLSCGGRIWQQTQAGQRALVVTVFAGVPDPGVHLSSFARELHARWEQSNGAVRTRQEEDLQALALLGAQPLHWPYTDCIYRRTPDGGFPYGSEEALWGDIHPSEGGLVHELAQRIRALPLSPRGMLYSPLAVGQHVDHRLVRQAAEAAGRPLTYYEDFPYAQDRGALAAATAFAGWKATLLPLSERALERKVAAIARYRSQISTFWGNTTAMAGALRAFAQATGAGAPAERYWNLSCP